MAKNKTTETTANVDDFIAALPDDVKKQDSFELINLMEQATGCKAKMWGGSIVGFGSYHYKYDSGHEGDAPLIAFSPRKDAISLYLSVNPQQRETYLKQLGKHKAGKGCIYVKKLQDINTGVLKEMIAGSVKHLQNKY